ncbi:MAG: metallophosphoesterase [Alphaproteobacteria bacterium]|nr:metallophosphoesterase [Alphaproteobacteria bacterium]
MTAGCTSPAPAPAPAPAPVATPAPQPAAHPIYAAWVQLVPGGGAEVRVINPAGCPAVIFNQRNGTPAQPEIPLRVRAQPDADYPFFTCSLAIPPGTTQIDLVAGHLGEPQGTIVEHLPVPVPVPQRILVLGDTGCRISKYAVQACNDPKAWPFATVSKAAAALKPDLVLHLGDYHYREVACPEGNAGCAGSPWGYNGAVWDADFFTPAAPLLAAAPWIVIRGNHEDCQRAGAGFERLLAPGSYDAAMPCHAHIDPYVVMAGRQAIAVWDNASADDRTEDAATVDKYTKDFAMLKGLGGAKHPLWLAGHRPIWAAVTGPLGVPIGGNINLIRAVGDLSALGNVSLQLSGHIHTFEAINYDGKVPPQIVAGHGGDNLDPTPLNLKGTIFQGSSGVHVKDGLSVGGFGFLMMTRTSKGWSIELYDSDGTPKRTCTFASGRVDCPPVK